MTGIVHPIFTQLMADTVSCGKFSGETSALDGFYAISNYLDLSHLGTSLKLHSPRQEPSSTVDALRSSVPAIAYDRIRHQSQSRKRRQHSDPEESPSGGFLFTQTFEKTLIFNVGADLEVCFLSPRMINFEAPLVCR